MAAPTFTFTTVDNANVFTKPTVNVGDWLLIHYSWFYAAAGLPTAPTGFAQVYNAELSIAGGAAGLAAFIRQVDGSEGATFTVTRGNTTFWDGGSIRRIQGADATNAVDDSGIATGNSATASTGAAITTTTAEDLLFVDITTNGQNPSQPTGMTTDYSLDGGDVEGNSETLTDTLTNATRSATLTAAEWLIGFVAIKPAAGGGTTFFQDVGGTLTSAGAVSKETHVLRSGTLPLSGVLLKLTQTALAGTLTSSGAFAALRLALISFTGTLPSAGVLSLETRKVLVGTLTSAGALIRSLARSLAGTLTSAGALTTIKVTLLSLAGTLTSSGALTKRAGVVPGGTLAPAGTLTREVRRSLAGTLTTAGALATMRAFFVSLGGALGFGSDLEAVRTAGAVSLWSGTAAAGAVDGNIFTDPGAAPSGGSLWPGTPPAGTPDDGLWH